MSTGIIVGEGISGTTNEYLANKFNDTGGQVHNPSMRLNHNTRGQVHNPSMRLNHNTGGQVHNPDRGNHSTHSSTRETMKKGKVNNMVEGRMKKFHPTI